MVGAYYSEQHKESQEIYSFFIFLNNIESSVLHENGVVSSARKLGWCTLRFSTSWRFKDSYLRSMLGKIHTKWCGFFYLYKFHLEIKQRVALVKLKEEESC